MTTNASFMPIIPCGSTLLLSKEQKDIVDSLPPVVEKYLHRVYVTGLCTGKPTSIISHLRVLLEQNLGIYLDEQIVSFIVNKNISSWIADRIAYLEELDNRFFEIQVKMEKSPLDERHYRLLSQLELMASMKLESAMETQDISIDDFSKLQRIISGVIKDIHDLPAVRNSAVKKKMFGGGKKTEKYKLVLERVLSTTDESNIEEIEDTVAELEEHTREVVDGEKL